MDKNHSKILSLALFAMSFFCVYKHLNPLAGANLFASIGFFMNGFIDLFFKNYDKNPRAYHKIRKYGMLIGYIGIFAVVIIIISSQLFKKKGF